MTRTEAKTFQKELASAIQSVLNKYNLTLTQNGVTFGETEVKVSLKMKQLNTDGTHKVDDFTERLLNLELRSSGVKNIPATIVGSKVQHRISGKTFIITGYNSRAQKYPIEAQEVSSGQIYKLSSVGLMFV